MKKILIFGAGGMIGHQMYRRLQPLNYQVMGTLRQPLANYKKFNLFSPNQVIENTDVSDFNEVDKILNAFMPDIILNCIGVTLRKPEITDLGYCQKINTQLPQYINEWSIKNNSHLIHFSTDCVFSGKSGPYSEKSIPDAKDIYGITKAQGEVFGSNALTLRGSMIGRELFGKTELLEWAISKKNQSVDGFTRAMYSGVTTVVMSNLIANLIAKENRLTGLYQVSSQPISKYDLLQLISKFMQLGLQIHKSEKTATEKILISTQLTKEVGFICPDWSLMIQELSKDLFRYEA